MRLSPNRSELAYAKDGCSESRVQGETKFQDSASRFGVWWGTVDRAQCGGEAARVSKIMQEKHRSLTPLCCPMNCSLVESFSLCAYEVIVVIV